MSRRPADERRRRPGHFARSLGAAALAAGIFACTGGITDGGQGDERPPDPDELKGAGGRDLTQYWPSIDLPMSQNTRMLSFEMMRNEVARATGKTWVIGSVDQWELNRAALGGADYVTTFEDDLTPSQQRIVLWRKMAFQVCGDLVASEAGAAARRVFTEVDPRSAIDPAAEATARQVRALFHRFFLADAEAIDVTEGVALLTALAGPGPEAAWRGLCVAYLGSMRFLTY